MNIFLMIYCSHVNRKTQYENPVAAAKKNRDGGCTFCDRTLIETKATMNLVGRNPSQNCVPSNIDSVTRTFEGGHVDAVGGDGNLTSLMISETA